MIVPASVTTQLSTADWPAPPSSSSARSIQESLIKSSAIHFTATATVGHLMSLRNFPDKLSATLRLYILIFFLNPMLPLAQLLRHLVSTILQSSLVSISGTGGLPFTPALAAGCIAPNPSKWSRLDPSPR